MLDALLWNVYVGQNPTRAVGRLRALIALHRPHVVGLNEATRLFGRLDSVPGYRVYQLRPRPAHGGPVNEDASSAVLVRDDVTVLGHRVRRMRRRWSHKRPHDPRVFHVVRLRLADGSKWRVAVVHYPPGGPRGKSRVAWKESAAWASRFLRLFRTPAVVLGDVNAGRQTVRSTHGRPVVAGSGVDFAIGRRVAVVTSKTYAKGGSDHRPHFFRFRRA